MSRFGIVVRRTCGMYLPDDVFDREGQELEALVLASPVLYLQSRYAPEFLFIVCDQCQTRSDGMGGDPQIVVADHLTLRFQLGPNSAVDFGGCFG
jgi:hypothetical protein